MDKKTNYLTSIRGIACLIVIIAHILASIPSIGVYVSGCGKIGVWLFFVLSAFLLTLQWMKEDKVNIKNIKNFYIKRFFRIYPCYIVTLIVALIIGYFDNFVDIIKHTFLIEGIGHLWTIPVEFIFYIIIPFLFIILKKMKNTKFKILFLCILIIIFEVIFPYTSFPVNSININWYIPVFLIGVILAYCYKYFESKQMKNIAFDILFCVVIILMLISVPYFKSLIFNINPDNYLQNKYLYFAIGWSIIIVSIQNSKYIIKYLNNTKIFMFLGNISFPLYLIHFIVLSKLNMMNNLILKSILVFVISIILSIGMNKLIETPIIKLSKKIINKNNIK